MTAEQNKLLIQRLVEEAVNQGNLDVLAEVADGEFARAARQWVGPFRPPSPTSAETVKRPADHKNALRVTKTLQSGVESRCYCRYQS